MLIIQLRENYVLHHKKEQEERKEKHVKEEEKRELKKRHEEKSEKYSALERDLTDVGYQADVTAFEIGCRGLIDIDNTASLKKFKKFCKKEINFKKFKENISALSTVSSYYIFTSRKEPSWSDTPFLTPIHQSQ